MKKELIKQEEFVEEFYKSEEKIPESSKLETNNQNLIEENNELNEMIKILSEEINSLKSQIKLQTVVDDYKKTLNQSYSPLEPPSSSRRLSRESSIAFSKNFKVLKFLLFFLAEKQRPIPPEKLINQNDFYYMLNAQATSLEALLS